MLTYKLIARRNLHCRVLVMDLSSRSSCSNAFGLILKVSSCGMSEAIGPVHIKERPSSDMQSRIDAEVGTLVIHFLSFLFQIPLP